jgi:hypothetical protein
MKLFSIFLLAVALSTFFGGCSSTDEGYRGYTATQMSAHHSGYDPTPHTYGTRY